MVRQDNDVVLPSSPSTPRRQRGRRGRVAVVEHKNDFQSYISSCGCDQCFEAVDRRGQRVVHRDHDRRHAAALEAPPGLGRGGVAGLPF